MITIKNTKIISRPVVTESQMKKELLVTEAKLILVSTFEDDKPNLFINGKCYKTILVSETEIPVEGDCIYPKQQMLGWDFLCEFVRTDEDAIMVSKWKQQNGYCSRLAKDLFYKVIALPEHFAEHQRQDILIGKLKEGKCLVECALYNSSTAGNTAAIMSQGFHGDQYVIKRNYFIAIHSVEAKTYPEAFVNWLIGKNDAERWYQKYLKEGNA